MFETKPGFLVIAPCEAARIVVFRLIGQVNSDKMLVATKNFYHRHPEWLGFDLIRDGRMSRSLIHDQDVVEVNHFICDQRRTIGLPDGRLRLAVIFPGIVAGSTYDQVYREKLGDVVEMGVFDKPDQAWSFLRGAEPMCRHVRYSLAKVPRGAINWIDGL